MADTFATTGGTANFWVYREGIERGNSSRVVERSIPWASNTVIDLTGPTVPTLTLVAYTTSASEYAMLINIRSLVGIFDWEDGGDTCLLKTVTGQNYFAGRFRDVKLEFEVLA